MIEIERRKGGDRRQLSGAQRAAALLIVLGKEAAPKVLQHLDKDEVRDIARAAATLGIVDRASLERMLDEFSEAYAIGPEIVGTLSEAQDLVAGSLEPDEVAEMVGGDGAPAQIDIWDEVRRFGGERLAECLSQESLWLCAAVLNKLDAEQATEVLDHFDETRRPRILAAMLTSAPIAALATQFLEEALFEEVTQHNGTRVDGNAPKRVADIINRLDVKASDEFFSYLAALAPERANNVRALVFKFDEITYLSQKDRLVLFDGMPTERIVLALQGASPELVEATLSSLGARARRMAESELVGDNAAPQRDIIAARRMIVETALRLSGSGTITLPSGATDGAA
ncbi:MAG: flagellar motor switch protein FliG [Rhodoblastus sp.]|nr:flagellar motor switch protein FliG [Rhodoblastus sp.]